MPHVTAWPSEPPLDWSRFQSDCGFVYFVGSQVARMVKIGHAGNPLRRCLDLATGSPLPLRLYALQPGTVKDERALHRRFRPQRRYGEWFAFEGLLAAYIEERRLPEVISFEGPLLEPPRYRAVLQHLTKASHLPTGR